MNTEVWKEAFGSFASEIYDLTAFKDLLNESRHHKFKEMTIHSMFGSFKCNCKSWSSTKCSTLFKYRYNPRKKSGEINIEKEYGQNCNNCEELCMPKFDLEATLKAMSIVIKRIKKVFYNQESSKDIYSKRHSRAQDRQNPHDSDRCEACLEGKCPFNEDYSNFRNSNRKGQFRSYYGPKQKIPWISDLLDMSNVSEGNKVDYSDELKIDINQEISDCDDAKDKSLKSLFASEDDSFLNQATQKIKPKCSSKEIEAKRQAAIRKRKENEAMRQFYESKKLCSPSSALDPNQNKMYHTQIEEFDNSDDIETLMSQIDMNPLKRFKIAANSSPEEQPKLIKPKCSLKEIEAKKQAAIRKRKENVAKRVAAMTATKIRQMSLNGRK